MQRPMEAATAAAAVQPLVRPVFLVEGDFLPDPLRLWTGVGELTWDDRTFTGAGTLIGIGDVEETTDSAATSTTFTLSGMPPELLASIPLPTNYQGRRGRLWIALLDEGGGIVGEPVQIMAGLMDTLSYQEGETLTFALTVENRLADLERARVRRYTDRDQQAQFPGDRAFEFVASLQDDEITWGRG